ncbi:MAG: DUF547 domain-containing protein [Alphaproteobacteria bacterium]|nr:MAG: DUF547 domain-containing protein [Alphaproteobacteria bacterium]
MSDMKTSILRRALAATALSIALALPAGATSTAVPEPFRVAAEKETLDIRYDDWSYILKATVYEAGRSDRKIAPQPEPDFGRRHKRGNKSPYRYEGNRIFFPAFVGENLKMTSRIRRELEAMPGAVPMAEWTRNQQLAYWLNLYNITIIEQLALRYPETSLKKVLYKKGGLLDEKLLTVAGVKLSLNDIHHKILIPNWQDPLVMYGLFHGYIGSANIRKEAYTAQNVYELLKENAEEFVNSNRGAKMDGDKLEVAELYKIDAALFPNFEEDVKAHVARFADQSFAQRVYGAQAVKAETDEYYIADLNQGVINDDNMNIGNPAAFLGSGSSNLEDFLLGRSDSGVSFNMPNVAKEYIRTMARKRAEREGMVSVEEYDDSQKPEEPQKDEPGKEETGNPE